MNHVRPSLRSDAVYIAARLRQADSDELALHDITALDALTTGVATSLQPLTAVCNGNPAAIFGVVPLVHAPHQGLVWLLGTDDIFTVRYPFLRQSALWLEHVSKPFSTVGNWVDSRNTKHVSWLRWLGFKTGSSALIKGVEINFYHKSN